MTINSEYDHASKERGYEQYPSTQTLTGRFEHTPLLQVLSAGQVFAHVPQLNSSLPRSTQVPLQKARPAGHKHFPFRQSFPRGQVFPHEPQLRESKLVSVHVPLHSSRPTRHEQFPLTQAVPSGQAFPHEPQFSRSTLVSVQVPLQRIVPAGQVGLLAARAELPIIPKARSTRMHVILQIIGVQFISSLVSDGYPSLRIMQSAFSRVLLAMHLFQILMPQLEYKDRFNS